MRISPVITDRMIDRGSINYPLINIEMTVLPHARVGAAPPKNTHRPRPPYPLPYTRNSQPLARGSDMKCVLSFYRLICRGRGSPADRPAAPSSSRPRAALLYPHYAHVREGDRAAAGI